MNRWVGKSRATMEKKRGREARERGGKWFVKGEQEFSTHESLGGGGSQGSQLSFFLPRS